ncbi:MAG: outer membrane protein assembly factor BamC [Halioglobus sp.]
MNRLLIAVSVVLASFLVQGCGSFFGDDGWFRDRSEDYKSAPEMPVVTLPQGTSGEKLREIYVIPEVKDNLVLEGEFEVPRPSPLVGGAGAEVVRIQKMGEQSWALIEVAPGQVWPQVRSFLAAAGLQVSRADARAGIMESNWVTLEDQSLPSRFQFRIDQGVQRATSELHILQMNRGKGADSWPAVSDDKSQEQDMLRAVAQYLADSADTAPVSMIAEQGISASGKVVLDEADAGYTVIKLGLPYDRAWASLGLALERSTFEVTDRDRSTGTYYATFIGPDEDEEDSGSWMGWLWNSDEGHPMAEKKFLIIMEKRDPESVDIRIRPQDENPEFDKREEQGLLSVIKGNIS